MKIKDILLLLLVLLSSYSNISLALGIGEIIIKSHLGEPLSAEINITDIEKAPDTNCFSVNELSLPPASAKPAIAIRQHKQHDHSYRLTIKTHAAITEPILNLHLTHNCDPNVIREYVILLDPPQHIVATTVNEENTINSPNAEQPSASATQKSTLTSLSTTQAGSSSKSHKNKHKKSSNSVKTSSLEDKLNAIYTGTARTAAAPLSNTTLPNKNADIKPRPLLSISGEESPLGVMPTLPQPALRLETQIDLSRAEQLASLSTTEVMDEITSIDNRLALMKNQIISLQDKNEKLKKDAEKAKMKFEDAISKLRIAAGLIALLALAEWIRRRMALRRAAKAEELWYDESDYANLTDESDSKTPAIQGSNADTAKDAIFNDAFSEKSHYGMSPGFSTSLAEDSSITTVNGHDNEDILESIDVLAEYGRYGLAIQILNDYVSNHPAESPRIWLKLLALIAAHGTEADYTHTREKSSHYYRIKLPDFAEARKTGTATLEDFPFIIKELESAWGSADALVLLDDLIHIRESQPEEGFEPEIFEELFLLKQIAENHNAEPDNIDLILKNSVNKQQSQTQTTENPDHLTMISAPTASELTQENDQRLPNESLAKPDTSVLQPESQNQAPDNAAASLSFDGYFTQDKTPSGNNATVVSDHHFISEAAESHTFDDSQQQSDTKLALDAPEFDFSDHFKAINEMQNTPADSFKKAGDKPQKRISKDSNLIDWVISDET